jgi:hypothetical protein
MQRVRNRRLKLQPVRISQRYILLAIFDEMHGRTFGGKRFARTVVERGSRMSS